MHAVPMDSAEAPEVLKCWSSPLLRDAADRRKGEKEACMCMEEVGGGEVRGKGGVGGEAERGKGVGRRRRETQRERSSVNPAGQRQSRQNVCGCFMGKSVIL